MQQPDGLHGFLPAAGGLAGTCWQTLAILLRSFLRLGSVSLDAFACAGRHKRWAISNRGPSDGILKPTARGV